MKTKTVECYEVVVKYDKTAESGELRTVKELYVVEAFTPTEAESFIAKELEPFMQGAFQVVSAKKAGFSEIATECSADFWYTAKVEMIALDENSGKEKRTAITLLVNAQNFKGAHDSVMEIMGATMADWECVAINKTKIVEFVEKKA